MENTKMKRVRTLLENPDWISLFSEHFESKSWNSLENFIKNEKGRPIFPRIDHVFRIYNTLSPSKVKLVILGQDPYHRIGQAHGFAFSVPKGVAIPPSLKNIFKEINQDDPNKTRKNGDLTFWVEQGVFLLNTVLTVREGHANSHKKKGWEFFTDLTIRILSKEKREKIFFLWGNASQEKEKIIDPRHLILKAPHPSPLSAYRGFIGCGHFSAANQILQKNHVKPIVW